MTEPGQGAAQRGLHGVEVGSAFPNTRHVFGPRCLGVGQHRSGSVLPLAEPVSGFGSVDSDGLELCWSEAQHLGTPKHPCVRASEGELASVRSCLVELPDPPRAL